VACSKLPVHDAQGSRIEWQGIFLHTAGSFPHLKGFLHTIEGGG
jgi:hypothetical protein